MKITLKGFIFPLKYLISNHLDFYSIFLFSWMHTSESIVVETDEKVRTETYQGNFIKKYYKKFLNSSQQWRSIFYSFFPGKTPTQVIDS